MANVFSSAGEVSAFFSVFDLLPVLGLKPVVECELCQGLRYFTNGVISLIHLLGAISKKVNRNGLWLGRSADAEVVGVGCALPGLWTGLGRMEA